MLKETEGAMTAYDLEKLCVLCL